jgi:hypothetical protein
VFLPLKNKKHETLCVTRKKIMWHEKKDEKKLCVTEKKLCVTQKKLCVRQKKTLCDTEKNFV